MRDEITGATRRRSRRDDEADARDLLRVQPQRQDVCHAHFDFGW